jgi:hypothetical protein
MAAERAANSGKPLCKRKSANFVCLFKLSPKANNILGS